MRRYGVALAASVAVLLAATQVSAAASTSDADAPIPVYTYRIVNTYPHDREAYTEGLLFRDGFLYESTGLEGHSSIRKVRLETGEILKQHDLSNTVFGEGISDWDDELVAVTWKSQTGYVFDLHTFDYRQTFHYRGEGWGMTHSAGQLLLSDGTAQIRFLDPKTLRETGTIMVTAHGMPVTQLNELEWIQGQIFANVWQTNRIARIDPKTGHVTGWIDLSGLLSHSDSVADGADVLNGIAYDAQRDRLFVTGKLWPNLFEIKLVEKSASN